MNAIKTFALIDNASGFVWYVGQAASATAACAAADLDTNSEARDFTEVSSLASNEGGYHVHEAPAGFEVFDGQDQEICAAVSAMPLVGKFKAI